MEFPTSVIIFRDCDCVEITEKLLWVKKVYADGRMKGELLRTVESYHPSGIPEVEKTGVMKTVLYCNVIRDFAVLSKKLILLENLGTFKKYQYLLCCHYCLNLYSSNY